MGWWCTNYAVGGFLASVFLGYVAKFYAPEYGIQIIFFAPAIVLFVIWLLFLLLQRNKPQDLGLPAIEEYHNEEIPVIDEDDSPDEEIEGRWDTILEVIKSPMILILGGVYFLVKPARYAILFWGPKFVYDKLQGSDALEAATVSSMFELAGPVSVLLGGYLSDKMFHSRRMPVCIICLGLLTVSLFVLTTLPPSPWAYTVTLFLIGLFLFAPDALISGTAAVDFGTRKGASTATGLVNGCGSVGAIIGVAAPKYIKEVMGYGWNGVFTFMSGMVLLATILLLPQWNRLPATKSVNKKEITT